MAFLTTKVTKMKGRESSDKNQREGHYTELHVKKCHSSMDDHYTASLSAKAHIQSDST
jgi:hypothetical protein